MTKPDFFDVFASVWARDLDLGEDWRGDGADLTWLLAEPRHRKVLARYCALIAKDMSAYLAYFIAVDLIHRTRSPAELIAVHDIFLEDGDDDDIAAAPLALKKAKDNVELSKFSGAVHDYLYGGATALPKDSTKALKALRSAAQKALREHARAVTEFYWADGTYDTNHDGLQVKGFDAKDVSEGTRKTIKTVKLRLLRAGYPAKPLLQGI